MYQSMSGHAELNPISGKTKPTTSVAFTKESPNIHCPPTYTTIHSNRGTLIVNCS